MTISKYSRMATVYAGRHTWLLHLSICGPPSHTICSTHQCIHRKHDCCVKCDAVLGSIPFSTFCWNKHLRIWQPSPLQHLTLLFLGEKLWAGQWAKWKQINANSVGGGWAAKSIRCNSKPTRAEVLAETKISWWQTQLQSTQLEVAEKIHEVNELGLCSTVVSSWESRGLVILEVEKIKEPPQGQEKGRHWSKCWKEVI